MKRRRAFLCGALAASVLFVAGCGGDGESTTSTQASTVEIVRIEVGKSGVAGGPVRATLDHNRQVAVVVHSALADEIHLHGYDLSKEVEAGGTVRIVFKATIPGTFEIELESRGLQIAELMVRP